MWPGLCHGNTYCIAAEILLLCGGGKIPADLKEPRCFSGLSDLKC